MKEVTHAITDALEGEAKGAVKKFSRREMLGCGVCLQDGIMEQISESGDVALIEA